MKETPMAVVSRHRISVNEFTVNQDVKTPWRKALEIVIFPAHPISLTISFVTSLLQGRAGHFCQPLYVPVQLGAHLPFRGWHMLSTHAGQYEYCLLGSGLPFRALAGRASGVLRIRHHTIYILLTM
jgi:hypothetical protein